MKSKITPIVSSLSILIFFLGAAVLAQSPMQVAPKMQQVKAIPAQEEMEVPATENVPKANVSKTVDKTSEMQVAPMADLTDPKQAAIEKKRLQAQLKKLEAQEAQSAAARKERDKITVLVKKRLERSNSKKQIQSNTKGALQKSNAAQEASGKAESKDKNGQ